MIRYLPIAMALAMPALAQELAGPSLLVTSPSSAQVAGPARPVEATKAPVQAAIDQARAQETRGTPRRCRTGPGGEITVCGSLDGSSPYRLPLPTVAEHLSGEAGRVDIGGSPVSRKPATGMVFTLKPGSKARVKGIAEEADLRPQPER